jgi:peroxin-3
VLALIPTLGKQVIQAMNVERLAELLNHTKSRQPQTTKPPIPPSETPDHNDNDNNHNNTHTIENTNPDHHLNNNTAIKNPVITIDHNVQDEKSSNSAAPATQDLSDLLVRPDGSRIQKRSEIWREMMIVSFSRLFTCLYGLTLLTLQTHLQLGLLGRDSYLSSIVSNENLDRESDFVGDERLDRLYEEQSDDNPLNSLTERRYLTFSYWYLHQGWLVLSERTRKAVEDILSSRNLKDLVSVSDLQEIFDLIRKSVELESDGTEFKYVRVSILDCSNIPPNKLPMI